MPKILPIIFTGLSLFNTAQNFPQNFNKQLNTPIKRIGAPPLLKKPRIKLAAEQQHQTKIYKSNNKKVLIDKSNWPKEIKTSNSDQHRKNLLPYILGGAIIGLGTADAIVNKDIRAPFESMKRGFKDFAFAYPKNIIRKFKGGKAALNAMKVVKNKQRVRNVGVNINNQTNFDFKNELLKALKEDPDFKNELNKKLRHRNLASEMLSSLLVGTTFGLGMNLGSALISNSNNEKKQMTKQAGDKNYGNLKNFAKILIKEDFLQHGIGSIPYYLGPALIAYGLNKDIRHYFQPVRNTNIKEHQVIVDLPAKSTTDSLKSPNSSSDNKILKKTANINENLNAANKTEKAMSWKHFFKYELPRRLVRGTSQVLIPATIVVLTRRDIRNALENIDKPHIDIERRLPTLPSGHRRYIIRIQENTSTPKNSEINKTASFQEDIQKYQKALRDLVNEQLLINQLKRQIRNKIPAQKLLKNTLKRKFRMLK